MPHLLRSRLRAAATLALAASGLCAASASAAITSSNVTSPANGAIVEYDDELAGGETAPGNQFTVSGTTVGAAPAGTDTVDLGCQSIILTAPRWAPIADDVPVGPDGAFSTSARKDAIPYDRPCTIRALPGDTVDDDRATLPVSAFTGPKVTKTASYEYVSDGGRLFDFYLSRSQSGGFFDYLSAASCGLDYSGVVSGEIVSEKLFNCNDYFYANFNDTRNGVQVDGKRAYLPGDTRDDEPGAPVLSVTRTVDPLTGDVTIVERDQVQACAVDDSFGSCPSFVPTGLRLERTITQGENGRQTTLADQWISTDGAAHRLDVIAEEDFRGGDPAFKASWEDTAFLPRDESDIAGGLTAGTPGTMYVDTELDEPDSDLAFPEGAITYPSGPAAFAWASDDYYFVRYLKTVPAGGKTDIVQIYSQAATPAELQPLADDATTRTTVAPPAPAPGQTTTTTVPGPTVVVPGAAPPARTVTVPTPQCVIPKLTGLTTAKAKAALKKAKCAVGRTKKKTTRTKAKVGKVLSASKQAGAGWKVGTKVDITVGKKAAAKKKK